VLELESSAEVSRGVSFGEGLDYEGAALMHGIVMLYEGLAGVLSLLLLCSVRALSPSAMRRCSKKVLATR
jgi:hypothetical protein